MKIDKIYVACHAGDLDFTRTCLSSIRCFYPEIPILLIKDGLNGAFDTRDIETEWNAGILETHHRAFGWGMSKLEPWLLADRETFLVLDSDIVFIGPVLSQFDTIEADAVVCPEPGVHSQLRLYYFDPDELQRFDRDYVYPGFTFNTGQLVGTSGIFTREEVGEYLDWNARPVSLKQPHVFAPSEQGFMNYFLTDRNRKKRLSLSTAPFMIWSGSEEVERFTLDGVLSNRYPLLIHWAGLKRGLAGLLPRSDILDLFRGGVPPRSHADSGQADIPPP